MLTNCLHTCSQLSLSLYDSTSCCVYFGPRCNAVLDDFVFGNAKITWNSSFKYLGIHFENGKNIGVNIEPIRNNFIMSCYNILSHSSGVCYLEQLQLHESYVFLTLTYVTAGIKLSETQIAILNLCWNWTLHLGEFSILTVRIREVFIRVLGQRYLRYLRLLSTKHYLSMQLCKNCVVREVFKTFMFSNEFIKFCILSKWSTKTKFFTVKSVVYDFFDARISSSYHLMYMCFV